VFLSHIFSLYEIDGCSFLIIRLSKITFPLPMTSTQCHLSLPALCKPSVFVDAYYMTKFPTCQVFFQKNPQNFKKFPFLPPGSDLTYILYRDSFVSKIHKRYQIFLFGRTYINLERF